MSTEHEMYERWKKRQHEDAARALSNKARRETRAQAIEASRQWSARPEYPVRDDGDDMPKTRGAVQ